MAKWGARALEWLNGVEERLAPCAAPEQVRHLPLTIGRAIARSRANRRVAGRLAAGYYAERLVVMPTIPRSASSVIGSCVGAVLMQRFPELGPVERVRRYGDYMLANQDSDLRLEMVGAFPEGGVVKYHTAATPKNLRVLALLGCRVVVLHRHPLDQLVTDMTAMLGDLRQGRMVLGAEGDPLIQHHISHARRSWFATELEGVAAVDATVRRAIVQGGLFSNLLWMRDWLLHGPAGRTLHITYEGFMADRRALLGEVSRFLCQAPLTGCALEACGGVADGYANRPEKRSPERYPGGWTGQVGTWRGYLTPETVALYDQAVARFIDCAPQGEALRRVYPDLGSGAALFGPSP